MKIAIVHDWLVGFAGAEQLMQHIMEIYPDADLFSVIDFLSDEDRTKLKGKRATTTFIQKLPLARSHYHLYLNWMPLAIEQLDLSAYDLVLSSSHAVAKGVITHPHQKHICYCHTPLRYAWDLQSVYLSSLGRIKRGLARLLLSRMRTWDVISSNRVDHFIANSRFVAKRIEKSYRREADVIYNGVDIDRFSLEHKKEDFYFTVSRLVPYKRTDLLVEAFAKMPDRQLIVIGDGPQRKLLEQIATPNVSILGYQSDEVVTDHLQRARAFLFAAKEDWGRVPVEAQLCGTPVIAYSQGGGCETVTPKTGVLFDEQTVSAVQEAVIQFEEQTFFPRVCRENAEHYSIERFKHEFAAYVNSKLGTNYESNCASRGQRDQTVAHLS